MMRGAFIVALVAAVALVGPVGAQTAEQIASLADPCPAVSAAHDRDLERALAVQYPDSALGAVGRGFAKVLATCGDARALRWFQDQIRIEAGARRPLASAFFALLEPVPLGDSLEVEHVAFLAELVRAGHARGRDETEPAMGRDLQSFILERLKRMGDDADVSRLYFELVGTGQLDPVFGEGRLLGHLVARRGDAFLGEYADVIKARPQILRDTDIWFYANQILYQRPLAPGSGAEKLAQTLKELGALSLRD